MSSRRSGSPQNPNNNCLLRESGMPETIGMPYQDGKTLTLSVSDNLYLKQYILKVKITRLFQPSTLSSVMEVDVLDSSEPVDDLPKHAVLKLYDRRYATQLRAENKIPPWTSSLEDNYREFVQNGEAAEFISGLEEEDDDDDPQAWDAARNEAFLFDYCRDLYSCETEVYRRLKDLQGKNIPKLFFADVRLNIWLDPDLPPADTQAFFEVPGILIEHIRGYSLGEIMEHAPPSSWQSICEEAIRIVNLVSDYGILNEDVKTRNVLIREKPKASNYEVIFIDFGHCRFREANQTEEDWMHEKRVQDEEGAIGYVMQQKLNGAFKYEPSNRFRCRCRKCVEVPAEHPAERGISSRVSSTVVVPWSPSRDRDGSLAEAVACL